MTTSVVDSRRHDGADVIIDGPSTREMAASIEAEMLREAQSLNFERAASLRDRLDEVHLQIALEAEDKSVRRKR